MVTSLSNAPFGEGEIMRIDKLLSNLQYGTRSEIKLALKQRRVLVNGNVILDNGFHVDPTTDAIFFDDKQVEYEANITLMMNKPSGYQSSHDEVPNPSLFQLLPEPFSRYPFEIAGRLDVDTEGLVILSTNGQLIHQIITPHKNIEKTYLVQTLKEVHDVLPLLSGVEILDGQNHPFIAKATRIKMIHPQAMELTITEGKYHQVKRMIAAMDNEVTFLKRIAIGQLTLPDDLASGEVRKCNSLDIQRLLSQKEEMYG